jgi:hypothetical protein
MNTNEPVKIVRCRGLYGLCIRRIDELSREIKGQDRGKYIEWSFVYSKLGRGFSLPKQEVREVILVLRDLGLLEISPKGIKLNFEVKNE